MRCSSAKGGRVVWDEENLRENAEIQKEYSAVRIAEPKTPYRPPLESAEQEEDEDMKPLELDQSGAAVEGAAPAEPVAATASAKAAVMTAFDFVMSNGGAEYTPPGPSRRRAASSTAADEAGDNAMVDAVGDKRSTPCHSFTSTDSEGCGHSGDPASADKKRRFEAMRKQHYNMKQALQKARRLLASEDEDDEADTAGWDKEALDGVEGGEDGGEALLQEQQERAAAGADDELRQQQQRRQQRQRQPDGADAAADAAGQADGEGLQLMDASSSGQGVGAAADGGS